LRAQRQEFFQTLSQKLSAALNGVRHPHKLTPKDARTIYNIVVQAIFDEVIRTGRWFLLKGHGVLRVKTLHLAGRSPDGRGQKKIKRLRYLEGIGITRRLKGHCPFCETEQSTSEETCTCD
jgi:hypothetical protein